MTAGERAPAISIAMIQVRVTLMPAVRAASGLAPTVFISKPSVLRDSSGAFAGHRLAACRVARMAAGAACRSTTLKPIFSKKDYEEHHRDLEKSSLEPFMGTGAYVLDSFKPGQQIIYKRNPDYWGEKHPLNIGQNNFDRIRIEYFGDDNAARSA